LNDLFRIKTAILPFLPWKFNISTPQYFGYFSHKMYKKMNINTLQPKHYLSASQLIATAYFDNPAHIYMFPNAEKRLENMEWLLGENLKLQLEQGAKSFCLIENGTVQAMGWLKSKRVF
jgi:hypothetical protein